MTSRHVPFTVVGRTHASNVMPLVSRSVAASGTVTRAVVPLNDSAPPDLPAAVHVAPVIVPVLPFPDASLTVVPVPSLNAYAATKFVCADAEPIVKLPAATISAARTIRGTDDEDMSLL